MHHSLTQAATSSSCPTSPCIAETKKEAVSTTPTAPDSPKDKKCETTFATNSNKPTSHTSQAHSAQKCTSQQPSTALSTISETTNLSPQTTHYAHLPHRQQSQIHRSTSHPRQQPHPKRHQSPRNPKSQPTRNHSKQNPDRHHERSSGVTVFRRRHVSHISFTRQLPLTTYQASSQTRMSPRSISSPRRLSRQISNRHLPHRLPRWRTDPFRLRFSHRNHRPTTVRHNFRTRPHFYAKMTHSNFRPNALIRKKFHQPPLPSDEKIIQHKAYCIKIILAIAINKKRIIYKK